MMRLQRQRHGIAIPCKLGPTQYSKWNVHMCWCHSFITWPNPWHISVQHMSSQNSVQLGAHWTGGLGVLFFDPVSILEENKKRTQRMIAIQPARTAATKTRAAAGKSCCLQQISVSGRRRKDQRKVWRLAMHPCLQWKGQVIHVVKCVLALQELWWMPSRTDDLWTRIWSLLGTQPLQAQSHFGRMGHAVHHQHVKTQWKYAKDSI